MDIFKQTRISTLLQGYKKILVLEEEEEKKKKYKRDPDPLVEVFNYGKMELHFDEYYKLPNSFRLKIEEKMSNKKLTRTQVLHNSVKLVSTLITASKRNPNARIFQLALRNEDFIGSEINREDFRFLIDLLVTDCGAIKTGHFFDYDKKNPERNRRTRITLPPQILRCMESVQNSFKIIDSEFKPTKKIKQNNFQVIDSEFKPTKNSIKLIKKSLQRRGISERIWASTKDILSILKIEGIKNVQRVFKEFREKFASKIRLDPTNFYYFEGQKIPSRTKTYRIGDLQEFLQQITVSA